MRWMKRLAVGVLAAGMALALLTACGSSKNDGVAPPVPITPPKTEAPNETITGHNVGGQYRYLQYRVVGTSGMGELKYVVTNGSDGSTYVGNDDKGVIISRWSRETDYRVDNTAKKIESSDPSTRTWDEGALHFFSYNNGVFSNSTEFKCYSVRYNGKEYLAEEGRAQNGYKYIFYYESAASTAPAYMLMEEPDGSESGMIKIEGWVVGSDMDSVIPEQYRVPTHVYVNERYSSYTGYSA